jgi:glycosyltransferase involved in cell wall biosynthesis
VRFVAEAVNLARNADVIWACSDSLYGVIACFLGRLTNVPVVFDLYDNFEFFLSAKLPVLRQLYHWTLKRCHALTCVSVPLSQLIKSYGRAHDVFVLENGVRLDLFMPLEEKLCRSALGLPQETRLIGTAGALNRNRGVHHLIDAFQRLRQENPQIHLALAGPRDPQVRIPDDPAIHYLGNLDLEQVPAFFNALDVAVICNLPNAFGLYCFPQKAREIMACDVPLIAARVGSMQEILEDHPEWLYEPGSPDSLMNTIKYRLMNPMTGYDSPPTWSDLAGQLEAVIRQVVDGRNPGMKGD